MTKFRLEDPEVQTIHLPLIFCALLDMLVVCSSSTRVHHSLMCAQISMAGSSSQRPDSSKVVAVLNLLDQMFRLVPFHSLTTALKLPESSSRLPYHHAACQFYRMPDTPKASEQESAQPPFANVFENLIVLTQVSAQEMLGLEAKGKDATFKSFTQAMLLLCDFVQAVESSHVPSSRLAWSPEEWVRKVLACLRLKVKHFTYD